MNPIINPKIGIIGAGKVGRALSWALSSKGYQFLAVSSRSFSSSEILAEKLPGCQVFTDPQQVVDICDLVFITTPDDTISHVVGALKWGNSTSVVHCSGVSTLDILQAAAVGTTTTGSLHPFQTFSAIQNQAEAVDRCKGVVFAIEGTSELSFILEDMVCSLNGTTIQIHPDERALYHSSAVLSCSHITAVIGAAIGIWEHLGLPREKAMAAILKMAKSNMENIAIAGIGASFTGPISRGDVKTIERHLSALEQSNPQVLKIYCHLGLMLLSEVRYGLQASTARDIQLLLDNYLFKANSTQEY